MATASPPRPALRLDLLTRKEAAEYLECSPQTLATWAITGRYDLPFLKIGRKVRYRRADLDRFLARRTVCRTAKADSL